MADTAVVRRASTSDAAVARASQPEAAEPLLPLKSIDANRWRALAERAIEPNAYYLPDWELAVSATAPGRTDASG